MKYKIVKVVLARDPGSRAIDLERTAQIFDVDGAGEALIQRLSPEAKAQIGTRESVVFFNATRTADGWRLGNRAR
jgi:hypothetical protein